MLIVQHETHKISNSKNLTIFNGNSMATDEIHCPKCGSQCELENQEKQQYGCNNCETQFCFITTETKSQHTSTNLLNCPECGNPLTPNEGYICTQCGTRNLCSNCVDANSEKTICKECLKQNQQDCIACGKQFIFKCGVCGVRTCEKHAYIFNVEIKEYSRALNMKTGKLYSLYCSTCESVICHKCFSKKEGIISGLKFYCKRCGSKLQICPPHAATKKPQTNPPSIN